MFKSKRWMLVIGLLAIAGLLASCAPEAVVETVIVEIAGEMVVVTATPEPVPEEEVVMVICQGQEPDTLYIYGGSMLAARHPQHAIYDGPIENASFGYQPVILEKLPALADGDAVIQVVTAKEGDQVVDNVGDIVTLAAGATVRPTGCRASECAIEYESGEVEMDQMVVTFELLEGLTWSDGEPLTVDDSVYAFELYMDPDTPTPSRYVGEHTTSYVAAGDLTAVWTGLPGYMDATYFINFWNPLPRHAWGHMTAAEIVESEDASRTPLGWGPFIITEWISGSHITAVKNPNYFRADEGLPKVDKVIFRFVGEEPNPAIAAIVAGDCDILTQDTHLDDQIPLLIEMEKEGALIPTFVTGTVWEHVDFGINPVETYDRPDFFEDVRTRQAIAMCIDRQAMVDAVTFGKSVVIHSYIPEEHPTYNPDVKQWPYDVAAANALLEEVGWTDTDGDGVREAVGVADIDDGTLLAFKWQSTTAEMRITYMQIVKENLALCGIDLTLDNMAAGQYFADGPEGPLFGRHFDLGSFAWLTGVEPPCDLYLTTQWPSEESGWAGQNDPGFSDVAYDEACNKALQSLPGTADYDQYHKEAQAIFSELLPGVPLFLRIKLSATRPEVTGFIMDPTINSEIFNIENFGFK